MEAFHPVVYGEGGYDPEVVSSPSNPYSWGRSTRFMAVVWNLNGTVVKSWYGAR